MNKAIQTIAMLLLLLAPCAASVAADEPEGQNAAPLYEAIWDGHLGYGPTSRGIHEESKELGEQGWAPGPVITQELADHDRMAKIIVAAQAEHCDFNLDYSLGPKLLIPHHSTMDKAATLLLADAQLNLNNKNFDIAADRIITALQIAHHADNQQYLLAVRIRAEVAGIAAKIALLTPADSWSDEQATRLLAAFAWFSEDDPFGLRKNAINEGAHFAKWIVQCSKSIEGREEFFDFAAMCVDLGGNNVAPKRLAFASMILLHGGLVACAEAYRQAVRDQVDTLDADDFEDASAQFARKMLPPVLEYGPLTPAFLPGLQHLLAQEIRSLEAIDKLRMSLENREI